MNRILLAAMALACGALGVASAQPAALTARATYGFLTHAAFFSVEVKPPNLVDPQVFVADPTAAAGIGPQGIEHVAGYRPALGVDDPATPIATAEGKALGFSLGSWFRARGTVVLTPSGDDTTATLKFAGLVRGGRYSMFENHFAPTGVTFTPLDGTGKTNSFTAGRDGSANVTVAIPGRVTHAEGLLLVYHSDGSDHGLERGRIGVVAHHQLIVRVP
ncbi:MAG: hypothetical protein GIW95_08495 [Candidatus Eremiobacteraeota bacterium]|nr:hypothetical protein [Candidatus Eremiobacteraeota bacterium]